MATAARAEEETELRVLREQVAADGRELSETVAALAGRMTEAGSPWRQARRAVLASTRQAVRRAAAPPVRAGWPSRAAALPVRAGWPKLAMTTGVLVIVAVAVTWQHRRHT
jgi:hypothetical protein